MGAAQGAMRDKLARGTITRMNVRERAGGAAVGRGYISGSQRQTRRAPELLAPGASQRIVRPSRGAGGLELRGRIASGLKGSGLMRREKVRRQTARVSNARQHAGTGFLDGARFLASDAGSESSMKASPKAMLRRRAAREHASRGIQPGIAAGARNAAWSGSGLDMRRPAKGTGDSDTRGPWDELERLERIDLAR